MTNAITNKGKCFCGSVEFTVTGEPAAMGYCHCSSCREWSAGPINAFTLWAPDALKITKGAANIEVHHRTDRSLRKWCKTCGGHLFTDHPALELGRCLCRRHSVGKVQAWRACPLPGNRATHEGRPAQAEGLPKEMGGSGVLLAE